MLIKKKKYISASKQSEKRGSQRSGFQDFKEELEGEFYVGGHNDSIRTINLQTHHL